MFVTSQFILFQQDLVDTTEKGLHVNSIYLDFHKAFDSVSHVKLLQIAFLWYTWLYTELDESFLSGRVRRVYIDGSVSSPLSVTFYLVFLRDLFRDPSYFWYISMTCKYSVLPRPVTCLLYAENSKLDLT